jgi:hypothetical protein
MTTDRSAVLDGERLAGSSYGAPDFVLYASSARWERQDAMSDEERRRVVAAVGEALRHYGIRFEVG